MLKNTKCKIHFVQADRGDSFLIELKNKQCILIDCGYKATYRTQLKPLLKKFAEEGFRIKLLVITHTDQDHIGGAIAFLKENGDSNNPKIIPIDNIWYNGIFNTCIQFPEIRKHIADAMDISVSEQIQKLKNQFHKLISVGDAEISLDLAENFESLCVKNNYFLNNGKISLLAGDELIFDACKIKAISPSLNELELFAKWINKNTVEMLGKNYCITDKEFISFLEQMVMVMGKDEIGIQRIEKVSDATPDIESWFGSSSLAPMNEANRASIVFELIIEDKVLLFTGDSDSADWINKARDYYDLVKISHHGTTKPNLKLLESVNFDKALISTNGRKNNHPENDCLARMIMKPIKELYFNYSISQKNELVKLEPKYLFSAIFEQEIIEL